MIKSRLVIIFLAVSQILCSCNTVKQTTVNFEEMDSAIRVSILDFSKSREFKKGVVFSLQVLELAGNPDLYVVRIGKDDSKILLTSQTKVGSKGVMPSKYFQKNGRLIYWRDNNFPVSQETFEVFKKFDLLRDDEGGIIMIPEQTTDDSQKNSHYYFCKKKVGNFKKVITSRGVGYYDPPELPCP